MNSAGMKRDCAIATALSAIATTSPGRAMPRIASPTSCAKKK